MTILNAYTKKVWKPIECTTYIATSIGSMMAAGSLIYTYIYIYIYTHNRSSSTKDKKMVIYAALLNTQRYKVKSKVEQSRERSSALPYTSV